jgi:outer membrane protein
VIGVWFFLAPVSLQAQTPETVSFKRYLQQVVDYYPLLKKENASIEKAVSQKALAASARVPQLWASTKVEYGDDPVYVFGALLRQNKFSNDDFALGRLNTPGPRSDMAASLEGSWLIFDFSQTTARIKSAGLMTESAQYQADLTRMESILAASELYSRLAYLQEFSKILNEVADDSASDVASAEALSRQGLYLGADFYFARMNQTKLMQLKNEIAAQHAALSMVFNILRGYDPAIEVQVSLKELKPVQVSGGVTEWILKALEERQDIKAMEKALQAQGIEVEREKKSFLPKIMAYAQGDAHAQNLTDDAGKNYIVGVKATMNIFDPGLRSRTNAAKAEVSRMINEYQQLKDQAAKTTAETFFRAKALSKNLPLALKVRDDSQKAVYLMIPLYREGKRSIDQMVSSRSALIDAYQQWLRLEYEGRQNMMVLKFQTGTLNQEEAEEIYEP